MDGGDRSRQTHVPDASPRALVAKVEATTKDGDGFRRRPARLVDRSSSRVDRVRLAL